MARCFLALVASYQRGVPTLPGLAQYLSRIELLLDGNQGASLARVKQMTFTIVANLKHIKARVHVPE